MQAGGSIRVYDDPQSQFFVARVLGLVKETGMYEIQYDDSKVRVSVDSSGEPVETYPVDLITPNDGITSPIMGCWEWCLSEERDRVCRNEQKWTCDAGGCGYENGDFDDECRACGEGNATPSPSTIRYRKIEVVMISYWQVREVADRQNAAAAVASTAANDRTTIGAEVLAYQTGATETTPFKC
jgi:hypothetical protein